MKKKLFVKHKSGGRKGDRLSIPALSFLRICSSHNQHALIHPQLCTEYTFFGRNAFVHLALPPALALARHQNQHNHLVTRMPEIYLFSRAGWWLFQPQMFHLDAKGKEVHRTQYNVGRAGAAPLRTPQPGVYFAGRRDRSKQM